MPRGTKLTDESIQLVLKLANETDMKNKEISSALKLGRSTVDRIIQLGSVDEYRAVTTNCNKKFNWRKKKQRNGGVISWVIEFAGTEDDAKKAGKELAKMAVGPVHIYQHKEAYEEVK